MAIPMNGRVYLKTKDFYYELPKELIAQTPLSDRASSRMLTLDKATGKISHKYFYELPGLLSPGDCLVLNDSRVLPARLLGQREDTGYPVEIVLLNQKEQDVWECLTRPGKRTKQGTRLSFGGGKLKAEIVGSAQEGNRLIRFIYEGVFMEIISELGQMPLPPYIKEKLDEPERYQTVYSRETGSAAAPTAGLHFTRELIKRIENRGVNVAYITLHVGLGTFRPVKVDDITEHNMHSEHYEISLKTAEIINKTKMSGGRVVAVGTTSCRTLESCTGNNGILEPGSGWTDIFIYPGYKFRCVDSLVTNFHLPESTLIMLVSALAGRDNIMDAYRCAVDNKYRFFSFGDAMFIY